MSVWYYTCKNCNEPASEYDIINCENGHELCSDCLPFELSTIGTADDIFRECHKEILTNKMLQKYIINTREYGYSLREEFCPVCQREIRNKQDPEYQEYLRLKDKFEN